MVRGGEVIVGGTVLVGGWQVEVRDRRLVCNGLEVQCLECARDVM